MNNFKKIASLMLALILVLAMAVPALAVTGQGSDTNGSITINNTVKDGEYSIYRIFDLESFDTEKGAYSYKVNDAWAGFFAEGAAGLNYVTITEGYVTWKEGASAAEFAADAIAYAKAEATRIEPTSGPRTAAADNQSITFSGLNLGYYLVDSSVGALCSLTTTKPDAIVIEKNSTPSLTKEVQENSLANDSAQNNGWGDRNDANVGEDVNYRATITVQGAAIDYVMHDQMDDGLTFKSVTGVTLNGAPVTQTGNYTVQTSPVDGHTFDVVFTKAFCDSLHSGDVIVVSYQATLNSNAVVAEPENNKAHLEYKDSNDVSHNTPDDETNTYTWEIPVLKYGNNDETKLLAGAVFSLYTDEACTPENIVRFANKSANVYQVAAAGIVTEFTTDATGRFRLEGLDAGTYYLKEIAAPAGYNRLETVVTVVIDHNGYINGSDSDGDGTMEYASEIGVNNNSGTELPSTGGMGTTILYVGGGILVLAAIVLLIAKRRMNAKK